MADMFDKEELGIVSGLFGNPLQRARAEQLGAYELYSKAAGAQNPFAGLSGLSGMFATGAGQDIRGALGLQNQQERIGVIRQQAQQQFDTNTPEGLLQMAEFLNRQGDAAGARQAVMLAQGQAQKGASLGKTMEETRILGRKEIEVGVPGDPEMVQKVLVDKDGNLIRTLGAPYSRFSQKTNIKVDTGDKNILDIDKKDAENLVKLRDTSERTIPRLEEQLVAVKKGMVSGSLNDARKVMLNSLATFGIRDKNTIDLLANTDKFNSNRIELASAVAKQLGVNPTDRDFQASLDRFASGSMQPEVAETFINDMLTIQRKNLQDAQAGLNYYRENKGSFKGYNRPLPQSPVASDPLANLSLEQLKALEAQLTSGKK
jgi:hypothetical protein